MGGDAADVAAVCFRGVLITLETQKGQLVIESESGDVEVKLLRDGKFYESLQIQPGANATRLYAGKYEVILSEGSDAVTLDQPTVEIKRGGTVIARVTEKTPVTGTSGDGRQPTPKDLIETLVVVPIAAATNCFTMASRYRCGCGSWRLSEVVLSWTRQSLLWPRCEPMTLHRRKSQWRLSIRYVMFNCLMK